MSNLDYPISVLEAERYNIYGLPKNRAEQLNEAIRILINERYKIEPPNFWEGIGKKAYFDEMRKKEKEKFGVVDEHLFKRRKE